MAGRADDAGAAACWPSGALRLGRGVAYHREGAEDAPALDGRISGSAGVVIGRRFHIGGFFEAHTFDFAALELSVGPQLQVRAGGAGVLMLRAGVGSTLDGAGRVPVGIQLGNPAVDVSVTRRKIFDPDGTHAFSADLELGWVLGLAAAAL